MLPPAMSDDTAETLVRIRVTPRARSSAVLECLDGVWRVAVSAPPSEGAANAALVRLVAKALGVGRTKVRVSAGERSRDKTLAVRGVSDDEVARRLGDAIDVRSNSSRERPVGVQRRH